MPPSSRPEIKPESRAEAGRNHAEIKGFGTNAWVVGTNKVHEWRNVDTLSEVKHMSDNHCDALQAGSGPVQCGRVRPRPGGLAQAVCGTGFSFGE